MNDAVDEAEHPHHMQLFQQHSTDHATATRLPPPNYHQIHVPVGDGTYVSSSQSRPLFDIPPTAPRIPSVHMQGPLNAAQNQMSSSVNTLTAAQQLAQHQSFVLPGHLDLARPVTVSTVPGECFTFVYKLALTTLSF